ncbi:MAG: LPS export ABC transporter periplasmic protein LptC [Flammeovirgaceae bacterium]
MIRTFFLFNALLAIWMVLQLSSCGRKEKPLPQEYKGPLRVAHDFTTYTTEKDHVKAYLKAKTVFEFQNGDREFPRGVYIEFMDTLGNVTSTLKANTAYYFKVDNKWRGRGNVEVKNIEKNQQLNTEELFWYPGTQKISTEKFVTIRDFNDVAYGTGLDAAQDMSNYTLKNPKGTMEVKEQ